MHPFLIKKISEEPPLDYIIIGSGFGGSVSALRLAEKGYNIAVLEQGKHFGASDFPKSDWQIRKYFWLPVLRCFGFQKISIFKQLFVVSGVGVGGGSLVYANTHILPPDAFYTHQAWARFKDWKALLAPFYKVARTMLGTSENPYQHREDEVLRAVATDMQRGETWRREEVGVYFGDTEQPRDPYFSGLGPVRSGCKQCAGCLIGCQHNAKNTLDKNYLWFAQKFGAKIHAETKVSKIEFRASIYTIHTEQSTALRFVTRLDIFNIFKTKKIFRTRGIVMSAGVLGTMQLLLAQKHHYKTLPNLSDRLGEQFRTNAESVCSVGLASEPLNHGIALSSGFSPDENTHIEVFKYPKGSGAMGALGSFATNEGDSLMRIFQLFKQIIARPRTFFRLLFNPDFGSNSILLLVMQSIDTQYSLIWRRGILAQFVGNLSIRGAKVSPFIALGQEVMHRFAQKVGGTPLNASTETFFNMATTAHVLGGASMGETAAEGLVNPDFAVHGYPNFYILDGSIVQGNLGVNPALTITALSEYAMSLIPERAENKHISLEKQIEAARK